ncbi:multidrug transporter subunit MdtD [Bdellovibrio bacteriovorus]|uniref:Drug resistance transporter, EmrB/QacA family protein n=1 Tax=Bdellovibrio bacteriovorus str. Tiberius TaxID=1069642 RepID=K7ZBN2_BDEBC|nr:multidrug transporter subunit MdtD [Bdellovibrio bacteriovorus]AFY02464.1 drug resistance transporter, EmrB/QacA family protein [Bdellovibrio bacteriovorus str. Tiberius]
MASAASANSDERSQNLLLWLVAIGFFMETLDSTIVNTALPGMAKSLGESPLYMQSVVIAYSLTIALLIPSSGWITDRFGTKKVYLGAILVFTLGSLCCAFSQTLPQLVISRVLQGAGGALLLPVGRLAVLRAFPADKFLQAISFVTIPGLIGPLIGPTLGGWLVEYASWHWIFLINIPVGLVGCWATYKLMPDIRGAKASRFDISGYVLLAFSMVSISFGMEGLAELGLRPGLVMILLVFGLASLAAYWLHAGRTEAPLFSLNLFKIGTYNIGLLGNLFARIGSGAMPFLLPLLLQVGLGYSPSYAGMMMIPMAVAGIMAKRFATPLITRTGYRNMLVGNTLLVGLTMASFALMSESQPMWLRLVQLFFFGWVNSLQFTAMNTLTLKDLGSEYASSGNSLYSMMQMLAMSLAVAAAGAMLTGFSDQFGSVNHGALRTFQWTFICMGVITCSSAAIFWQVPVGERKKEPIPQSEPSLH